MGKYAFCQQIDHATADAYEFADEVAACSLLHPDTHEGICTFRQVQGLEPVPLRPRQACRRRLNHVNLRAESKYPHRAIFPALMGPPSFC